MRFRLPPILAAAALATAALTTSLTVFGQTAPTTEPAASQPTTSPSTQPADAIEPATVIPPRDSILTATDAARGYFSLIKANAPRVAVNEFVDFDAISERAFGDDAKALPPLEHAELDEVLRQIMYMGFNDLRVGEFNMHLIYGNFHEKDGAAPDTREVEFEAIGGPAPAHEHLTLSKIKGQWRIVDISSSGRSVTANIGMAYNAQGKQLRPLLFCRAQLDPRIRAMQQQRMQQQQQQPDPSQPPGTPPTPTTPPQTPAPTPP